MSQQLLCNSKIHQQARTHAGRPCSSRNGLQPVCIHKEYSQRGIKPAQRPSSNMLLTTPEDIVIECLTLMRKGELSELAPYIPQHTLASQGAAVHVAGVPVHEQGPLARCAPFMDTAARRVLPGHLLRRARIQSSLQLGGSCLLRVSLTACTGEEVLLNWRLGLLQLPGLVQQQQQPQQLGSPPTSSHTQHQYSQQQLPHREAEVTHNNRDSPACDSSSSSDRSSDSSDTSSSSSASWQVISCERDKSADDETIQLPKGPHTRTSPELVVLAQLHALRQDDIMSACGFNILGRHAAGSGWDTHLTAFRNLLKQPHFHLLASHTRAELGGSALPSQRHFLQEVVLYESGEWDSGGAEGSSSTSTNPSRGLAGRFLWRLGMQADGCWMVRSIEAL